MKYNGGYMRKARILLLLGTWVAVLPYLGFPYSWKDTLFFLTGLILIGLSYFMYRDEKKKGIKEKTFDNFKENNFFNEKNDAEKPIEEVVANLGHFDLEHSAAESENQT
jgi:cbb3-type cytochrome oxidase subunit 3